MGMTEKICALCNESCADRPRIKDDRGHYYCRACYDEAVARKRARASSESLSAPPPVAAPPPSDGMSMLAEAIADEAQIAPPLDEMPCPNCQAPIATSSILCVNCGYNIRKQSQVATATGAPGAAAGKSSAPTDFSEMILGPAAVGLGITIIFGVLLALAMSDNENAAAFVIPCQVYSLVVGIVTLVAAFREGIGQGFLTLCVPFYAIYFVFGVNENGHLKAAFSANLAAMVMFFVLVSSNGFPMTDLPWNP